MSNSCRDVIFRGNFETITYIKTDKSILLATSQNDFTHFEGIGK